MALRSRASVLVAVLGSLLAGAVPSGADAGCDTVLVGTAAPQRLGVARPAAPGQEALLGVRRDVSVQGVRGADGRRPWVRVDAPTGFDHVGFGHRLGSQGSDLLVVDAAPRSCDGLLVSVLESGRGRTRWTAPVPLPAGGQRLTGWLVPAVTDVTGDGVDDAVVEVRTSSSDRSLRNADGRLDGSGGTAGAVHLVDGSTGRVALLREQPDAVGAGPFAGVAAGLLLTGTSTRGSSEVVARLEGRPAWRATVPTEAGAPLLRSTRVGPVVATSAPVAGTVRTHRVVQLAARTGAVVWQRTWSDAGPLQVLESGGDLLVRLGGLGRLERVGAADGATAWSTGDDLTDGERLVGDVDGDGAADVVVPGSLGTTAVLSGRSGAALHPEVLSHLTGDAVGVGDLDADGYGDLVGTLAEQDPREQLLGGGRAVPHGLTAVSGRTGAVLWTTGERLSELAVLAAEVRSGRGRDVVVHDPGTGLLALRAGRTGRLLWQVDLDE